MADCLCMLCVSILCFQVRQTRHTLEIPNLEEAALPCMEPTNTCLYDMDSVSSDAANCTAHLASASHEAAGLTNAASISSVGAPCAFV